MALSLRPTGLSSPAFADWADYCVIEEGKTIARIYEDRNTLPELRWFWSITLHADPALGITTNGRVPMLEEARRGSSRVGVERVNTKTSGRSRGHKGWQTPFRQVIEIDGGPRFVTLHDARAFILRLPKNKQGGFSESCDPVPPGVLS